MAQPSSAEFPQQRIGLVRRIAAMLYDGLLCLAVVFVATAALLPFTDGHAIGAGTWWYDLYLLGVCFIYFGWFWTHGGQTLGMKAWKIRVHSQDDAQFTWGQAAFRYVGALVSWAPMGLGFLWIWLGREKLSWHDRWSNSHLLSEPRSS